MRAVKIDGLRHRVNDGSNFSIMHLHGEIYKNYCILLHTPAYFTLHGEEQLVPGNQVILLLQGEPHFYRGCGEDFVHDWFSFRLEERDREQWECWNMPSSTPIPVGVSDRLSRLFEDMCFVAGMTGPFGQEILNAYAHCIFWWVSEAADLQRKYRGPLSGKYAAGLQALRKQMYLAPAQVPEATEAAAALYLSRSRFDTLYKEAFGQSYQSDVINARVQFAKQMLQNDRTVAEVATACGYASVEHFIRQFRQHTGMTPHQFRRSLSV